MQKKGNNNNTVHNFTRPEYIVRLLSEIFNCIVGSYLMKVLTLIFNYLCAADVLFYWYC